VTQAALAVAGLSKTFGGVRALRDAAVNVRAGEIHGLVGENGSGKSTLIKVLAGFHQPDEPIDVEICGQDVSLPLKPGEASKLGLAFVHQDLGLINDVSVLENLLIEDFATQMIWRLSWRAQRRRARAILDAAGLDFDLDEQVGRLRATERALLAIARATARIRETGSRGLLVLDEPTVYLPEHDRERLFDLMRSIAREGLAIIFVSHDVDEVLANTDRVTVMRDGRVVGTVESARSSADELIALILGRALAARVAAKQPEAPREAGGYRVAGLAGRAARQVTLEIRRGEILGLTGLPGAGFDDIPYLIFGAEAATAGTLNEHALASMTPARAIELGMALIPADRPRAGAVGSLPVVDNLALQVLPSYRRGPMLSRGRMLAAAENVAEEFDVRPRDPRIDYASLSGGNQQKVLLAKWFLTRPELLLLHEPTQGVDIGAREEIFTLLRQAAAGGAAVVIASSDHEQLAAVCSRVAVVRAGRVAVELHDAIAQEITDACYAGAAA
jgi:ribose transport system ATP-binding protein